MILLFAIFLDCHLHLRPTHHTSTTFIHDASVHIPGRRRSVAGAEDEAEYGRPQAAAVNRAQQPVAGRPGPGADPREPGIEEHHCVLQQHSRLHGAFRVGCRSQERRPVCTATEWWMLCCDVRWFRRLRSRERKAYLRTQSILPTTTLSRLSEEYYDKHAHIRIRTHTSKNVTEDEVYGLKKAMMMTHQTPKLQQKIKIQHKPTIPSPHLAQR